MLRDVDKKSVFDIGKEMAELAERARLKKISADDMRGGRFTISNLGGIGGTGFTPIINYPEVATTWARPRWVTGERSISGRPIRAAPAATVVFVL